MIVPLLRTKFAVPPVRSGFLQRPRLTGLLSAGLDRKLTLVSAPAGFGKTTLLGEWVQGGERSAPCPYAAWVSLDKGDNDPARFWAYFISALQTVQPELGRTTLAALQSTQPPPPEVLLSGLINEIAGLPGRCALILDDFHAITAPQTHTGMVYLLDNLPQKLHLIVSSRTTPPWPLGRMRARGEINELGGQDLRFTPTEVASFLNSVMSLGLSATEINTLDRRTEGWIAGLQLAALSMQGRDDVHTFVQAFSGSHRYVLDYLVEDVLERQPGEIQEFLFKTSLLEHMTASLCDAVTGRTDSQDVLTQLEQANLFLVPLDSERRWYRYHHLFAELLLRYLGTTYRDEVPVLHRRASEWYEQNELIADAVSHASLAGDVEQVARLVEGNAFAMMRRGELDTLLGWLDALPPGIVRSRPWLCTARAWTLVCTGRLDLVEPALCDAEAALEKPDVRIAGHIAALRAYVAELDLDAPRVIELAHRSLELLPADDLRARAFAAYRLATGLYWTGKLTRALEVLAEASDISRTAGDYQGAVMTLCDLAFVESMQGRLHLAVAKFQEALRLADKYVGHGGQRLPATGQAYMQLSLVYREWNELDAALRYAQEGIELCRQWGHADILIVSNMHLARVLQAVGDTDGAQEALRRARYHASDLSPWYVKYSAAWEALVRLALGDVAAASRWAEEAGLSFDDELGLQNELSYRVLARTLIAQGRNDKALALLQPLLELQKAAGATYVVTEILVLQALALQAQGDTERALAALERALTLAEAEGCVRIFVDEAAPMGQLLQQAATQGIMLDYVGRLLAALENEPKGEPQISEPHCRSPLLRSVPPPVEPLTERELEVLRLLTTHLSTREIAAELIVSVNTVRSHVRNIYTKLGVHRRAEAVERARELKLL
jgi:LuxR family maltose regulon positive regulatory protein